MKHHETSWNINLNHRIRRYQEHVQTFQMNNLSKPLWWPPLELSTRPPGPSFSFWWHVSRPQDLSPGHLQRDRKASKTKVRIRQLKVLMVKNHQKSEPSKTIKVLNLRAWPNFCAVCLAFCRCAHLRKKKSAGEQIGFPLRLSIVYSRVSVCLVDCQNL